MLNSSCVNKRPSAQPILVTLPNGDSIISTHEALLPFPHLPDQAINAHIFLALHRHALLSVGTFCDAGCTAEFTAGELKIKYKGETVLVGARIPPGLWQINLNYKHTPHPQANGAYTNQLKSNAIKFLHAACFSPTTATWTKAIDQGFFQSVPLLTSHDVRRNLPKSMATAMGHLDQQRKNVRSTKKKARPSDKEVKEFAHDEDTAPTTDTTTNMAYATILDLEQDECTGKSYSDLTGRFPAKSQQGNLYVLILYTYDDNAILVEPLKTRSDADQLKAYEAILTRAGKGTALTMHWMDNEASIAIKRLLTEQFKLEYQLVPPHTHRRNAAERAIRTFKNHFIAGLCSADNEFPIRLWDRLVPQAE
jgi:hypothetical protein